MQAALKDLDARHDSQSFMICQRVLLKCHEIIFGDLPPPISGPYSSLNLPFRSRFARRKIKHHSEPAMVGIGVVLAGVPGMPQLTEIMGEVAVEQGRIPEAGAEVRNFESQDHDFDFGLNSSISTSHTDDEGDDDSDTPSPPYDQLHSDPRSVPNLTLPGSNTSTISRQRRNEAAQTAPALPLHLRGMRRSRISDDPLGQLDSEPISSPYQSSPSISSSRPPLRSASTNVVDVLLATYDSTSQMHLLRSHFCRSEVCARISMII